MTSFPGQLRRWRQLRELSQQELAARAGVSARHLSFLETGRAGPSREMIERLVAALQLAQPAGRELLEAAGFVAPWLPDGEQPAMDEELQRTLGRVLQQHEPYPALLLERSGAVRQVNAGALRLVQLFAEQPPAPPWTIHGLLHGLRASFADWEEVLSYTTAFFGADSRGVSAGGGSTSVGSTAELPAVFTFRLRRGPLRAYLSTLATQLSVASNAAEAGLRLELFQPLDEATEALLRSGG
jgi:transcriptional regulator with XRE-family HTH domain